MPIVIVDGHEYHKRASLMGDYTLCGIGILKVCLVEEILNAKIVNGEDMLRLWLAKKTMVIQGKSPSCNTWILQPLSCWTTYVQD